MLRFGRAGAGSRERQALIRQYELVEKVRAYDPGVDENLLNRAYVFSMRSHGTQKRASGDLYFSHPLEVAGILTEMKLEHNTIVTALLHDVVEDTVATIEEIEELFGKEIAKLVDGVTKLSKLELQTESERQAENFRKFLIALSDDIRVLLVKLADRLHNMRTLQYIKKPEKRLRIAAETMEIYAPLAERIGWRELKDELAEIAFREMHPEAYDSVSQRLQYLRKKGSNIPRTVSRQIRSLLKKNGIVADVVGREKTPLSIWNKMERLHMSFEQLSDVMAFRVIVDDIPTCYRALGVVHGHWPMIPGTFDDYISTPKRNGYQSIHTAVIGPRQLRIEIQIRTGEMHEVSEFGVAAHWRYKQAPGTRKKKDKQFRWIQELLEILEHASDPEEFLEHTKLEMFHDQVFCFTPKGELIPLPRGSTPVDFAYAVHTDVGNTTVGAKVNGRHVPLRHQLENGDQIEILRSKAQKPSPTWLGFVITGRARASIKRHVRNLEKAEYREFGKTILQNAFRREKLGFKEKEIKKALAKLKLDSVHSLYEELGRGLRTDLDVLRTLYPTTEFKYDGRAPVNAVRDWQADGTDLYAIPISGLTAGMAVHLAECCYPLPGDRIVGSISKGEGVIVHTIDCETLPEESEEHENWLDLSWTNPASRPDFYAGRLNLVMVNEAGALANICSSVARHGGNISNLKVVSRDPDFFTMHVDVEVRNVKHLTGIIAALRTLDAISAANRIRG
jgi:GTP diphosphokinase / guanosine-3',5'-bis(diphosphate) 3'-diphosphatase